MATTTTSGFLGLNLADIGKGLIVTVITAALTVLENMLTTTPIKISWGTVATVAGTAGIAYLLKNLFTPASTVITPAVTPTSATPPKS